MNWNKIINIFIAIFLMINIAIFSFNLYRDENRYTLSTERENQLKSILNENGVTLYSTLPKYFPMKKIVLETPKLNEEEITGVIFGDDVVTTTFTDNYHRYASEEQELNFLKGTQKGKITYKGTNIKYVPKSFSRADVEKVGNAFAEDITLSIPKLKLTSITKYNDYYFLEYNEVYKGHILFCSYVSMKVTIKGVEEASALRYTPVKFTDSEEELYPIDEALYSFMSNVKPEEGELYFIKSIDLGYDLGIGDFEVSAQAVPYYRIKLDSRDAYYYINAYTNEFKLTQ